MKLGLTKNEIILGGLCIAAWGLTLGYAQKQNNEKIDQAKAYIQTHNPQKFNELNQAVKYKGYMDWNKEVNKIRDSLKIDSIAKTNYALGMQAVRDSLVNANKK